MAADNDLVIVSGPYLARLLMASHGGHFFQIEGTVRMFVEEYRLGQGLLPLSKRIHRCLRKHPRKTMRYLEQVSRQGYAPIKTPDDAAVEMLVMENVAGTVSQENSVVVGRPKCGSRT